jgi:hypothetical protein
MLQIVYISTARRPFTDAELEELLAVSRRNNRLVGVTGLLVAGGRRFLQAIEGPESSVAATMARIAADPRHFAIVELNRCSIAQRVFGEWEMAFQKGGEGAGAGSGATASLSELLKPIDDKTLMAQFAGFAQLHDRAA